MSIDVSGVLKSPTMIVFPPISPFMSVSICGRYLGILRVIEHHEEIFISVHGQLGCGKFKLHGI